MSQKSSSEMPLPSFVDVGTLRDMSAVASKIAVIRRYAQEIRRIEVKLLKDGTDDKGLKLAMDELTKFGKVCGNKAEDAIRDLDGIRQGIEIYLRRIRNVPD